MGSIAKQIQEKKRNFTTGKLRIWHTDGMKKNKIIKIGFFLDIPGLAKSRMISGFFRFARNHPDWQIYQYPVQTDSEELRRIVAAFATDAIVTGHADVLRAYSKKGQKRLPYIILENIEPGFPSAHGAALNVDNRAIGRFAVNRLATLGYRNLAYIGPLVSTNYSPSAPMQLRYSKLRKGAFERAATEAGIPIVSPASAPTGKPSVARKSLCDWFRTIPKPCGILCFSDDDAQYVSSICNEMKINVPREIGMLGTDNEEYICENAVPSISSIEPDYEQAGFMAGEMLAGLLAKDPGTKGVKRTYGILKIESRSSTQSLSSSTNRVAQAMNIVRRDLANAPTPSRVAAELGISLRILELAFKEALGHGIAREIIDTKLEKAKALLKSTRLSIGEIALKCGFSNYDTFKIRFGIAPGDWRKEPYRN